MSQYPTFDKLSISFDTGPVPPPFCHKYDITIHKHQDSTYTASLKLDYYDRDEITEEDIIDEGFSLNDNFEWNGKLPEVWGQEVEKKLSSTNWGKKDIQETGYSTLELKYFGGRNAEILYPADKRSWETFAQEIIQAIFELGEKEAPLEIIFLLIDQAGQQQQLRMMLQFSDRSVVLSSNTGSPKSLPWNEGQKLLQYIFFFDYLPEDSLQELPENSGSYIDPGDGFWYSFDNQEPGNEEMEDRWEKLVKTLKLYF
jgi:hypothetical protein